MIDPVTAALSISMPSASWICPPHEAIWFERTWNDSPFSMTAIFSPATPLSIAERVADMPDMPAPMITISTSTVSLFSGRVPWGIIDRVVKLGAYAIISPGAPTDMSIKIAGQNQIMLVGFAKNGEFNIYAHEELLPDGAEGSAVAV